MKLLKIIFTGLLITGLTACGGESQIVKPGQASQAQSIQPEHTSDSENGVSKGKNKSNAGVEVMGTNNDHAPSKGQLEGQSLTPEQIAAAEKAKQSPVEFMPVIYFDYNAHQLSPKALETIQHYANILVSDPKKKLKLTGNTDERGTPEYNLALGEKRADSVAEAFMLYGVSENQIELVTLGEENPVAEGHNEAAWAKNRRVDIKIY